MNIKMMLGIAAILGLIAVPVVAAAPIQAYVNHAANSDILETQDRDRLRTDCDCTCLADQNQTRLRLHECMGNKGCNGATEMEQSRSQHRCQKGGN